MARRDRICRFCQANDARPVARLKRSVFICSDCLADLESSLSEQLPGQDCAFCPAEETVAYTASQEFHAALNEELMGLGPSDNHDAAALNYVFEYVLDRGPRTVKRIRARARFARIQEKSVCEDCLLRCRQNLACGRA